jgi:hypothetical protein
VTGPDGIGDSEAGRMLSVDRKLGTLATKENHEPASFPLL